MNAGIQRSPEAETALVTGFPTLLGRGLVKRGLNLHPDNRMLVLVDAADADDAAAFVEALPEADRSRVELLVGNPDGVDLGLAGAAVVELLERVTRVLHAGHAPADRARPATNARRLDTILQLAAEMKRLRRIAVFSTAFVSGDRSGVVLEEELDAGQRLRTPFERSMFDVERLARSAMPRLPITVLRPSAMIGHSRTGEVCDVSEGPTYLMSLMVRLPAEMPILLPGTGVVPFNIVPVDYVVQASWALALDPAGSGRTFHLTDPNPVSARKAFDLLSARINRPAPFAGQLATGLLTRTLRLPGVRRLAPARIALLEDLTTHVTYSCSNALDLLAGSGVVCPPFESYAETLVAWLAAFEREKR